MSKTNRITLWFLVIFLISLVFSTLAVGLYFSIDYFWSKYDNQYSSDDEIKPIYLSFDLNDNNTDASLIHLGADFSDTGLQHNPDDYCITKIYIHKSDVPHNFSSGSETDLLYSNPLEYSGLCLGSSGNIDVYMNGGSPTSTVQENYDANQNLTPVILKDARLVKSTGSYSFSGTSTEIEMYPFDKKVFYLYATVLLEGKNGEEIAIAPIIFINYADDEWDRSGSDFSGQAVYDNKVMNYKEIGIISKRPIFIQLITIVILLTATAFIVSIIFIKDVAVVLEASVGILLGLWGIQSALFPPDLGNISLLRISILFLYILLAASAFVRLAIIPLVNRLVPEKTPKKNIRSQSKK